MSDQSHRKADPVPTPAIKTTTENTAAAPAAAPEKPKRNPDAKADVRSLQDQPEGY